MQNTSQVFIVDQSSCNIFIGRNADSSPIHFSEPFFYRYDLGGDEDERIYSKEKLGDRNTVFDPSKGSPQILPFLSKDGGITDWDRWTRFIQIVTTRLEVDPTNSCFYMMLQPLFETERFLSFREDVMHKIFGTLNFSSVFFGYQSAQTLNALGLATGLVVHIGYYQTYVVPVYKSIEQDHAVQVFPIGGLHISRLLTALIHLKYKIMITLPIAEEMKQQLCYVAKTSDIDSHEKEAEAAKVEWKTKEGLIFQGIGKERVISPEVLFEPPLIEIDEWSLQELATYSIAKCDGVFVPELWKNIVLSGFHSRIEGLATRLQHELAAMAPDPTAVRVIESKDIDPGYLPFLGAKKMTEFEKFHDYVLSKSEFVKDTASPLTIRHA